jgi:hypothetical protein
VRLARARNGQRNRVRVECRAGQHVRWHADQIGPVPALGLVCIVIVRHDPV